MYFPKPSLNENDLAIIERGDTATHSIEAGQYVSWKGKLGKANAAILQGTTLDDSLFDYETDGVLNKMNDVTIESGREALTSLTNTASSGSTTFYYKDITFTKTMKSVPRIIISTYNGNFPYYGDIGGNYFTNNVSQTGFRLYCRYNVANYWIDWIAIDS